MDSRLHGSMKLIHCADLHLGAAMGTHLPPDLAAQRRRELLDTFVRLTTYAAREGVAAVLIAGDLFDTEAASQRTARTVLDAMRAAPDVAFYYLRGNHDGAGFGALQLPDNLHLFGADWTHYRLDTVEITGAERPDPAALHLSATPFQIVLLHGGTELLPALRGKGIGYLAMGHLHTYQEGCLDAGGVYAYPGCLEGRGFDECGEKGFLLLELAGGSLRRTFVPFARRTLHQIAVPVGAAANPGALLAAIEAALPPRAAEDLVRVTLTGAAPLDWLLDSDYLELRLRGRCYCLEVVDGTTLTAEAAVGDVSLKGALLRQLDRVPEPERERIYRCAMQALAGEEILL